MAAARSIKICVSPVRFHELMDRVRVREDRDMIWKVLSLVQYFVLIGLSQEATFAIGEVRATYMLPVDFTARHAGVEDGLAYVVNMTTELLELADGLRTLLGDHPSRARVIEGAFAFFELCLDAREGGATLFKIAPGKDRVAIPWTEVPFL